MALNKKIYLQSGVGVHYHRISDVMLHSDDTAPMVRIKVDSYTSEESRRNDVNNMLYSEFYSIKLEPYEIDRYTILELAYQKLRELAPFEHATNC